jgi:hypothetical protein
MKNEVKDSGNPGRPLKGTVSRKKWQDKRMGS